MMEEEYGYFTPNRQLLYARALSAVWMPTLDFDYDSDSDCNSELNLNLEVNGDTDIDMNMDTNSESMYNRSSEEFFSNNNCQNEISEEIRNDKIRDLETEMEAYKLTVCRIEIIINIILY